MAANMIGVVKCIIVVNLGLMDMVMFNPKITKQRDAGNAARLEYGPGDRVPLSANQLQQIVRLQPDGSGIVIGVEHGFVFRYLIGDVLRCQVLVDFFFAHGYTLFLCCSLLFGGFQHFLDPLEEIHAGEPQEQIA